MFDAARFQLVRRPKSNLIAIRAPEGSGQFEELFADGIELHSLQDEMAQEESQVHGRIAEVSGLIIHKGETTIVGKNVLGTVIAVTESLLGVQHPVGNLADLRRHFRPALLNATIKRINSQLNEHGVIAKW